MTLTGSNNDKSLQLDKHPIKELKPQFSPDQGRL